MEKIYSIFFRLTSALTLGLLFFTGNGFGQKPTVEQVKKVLGEGAKFTAADLEAVEKGEIVVKKMEVEADGEVAFCSALKLTAPRDAVFDAFRRAIERQQREVADEYGAFGKPPQASDLKSLTIKNSEIRALKNCQPGDCSWSLSNDLIKRFQNEIDWNSADADEKATELMKQIMAGHFQGYLTGGDQALMTYNDDPEPLSLADEQRSLLDGLLWINDFAPEFKDYLREFPKRELPGIEDLATWSKVRVGFKPVIINTHIIFYKKDADGVPQGLIASKQIYANHYFHSSLSLTGIVSFPNPDGTFATYVFFESHSRAGALTGKMGQLARVAVDGEAEGKMTDVLKDTRRYTAYALGGDRDSLAEEEPGFLARLLGSKLVWLILVLAMIGLIFWLTRRRRTGEETA
ncbi:MAG: hypothetical protein R2747_20135 [Pyrinomonadaceae bacterium]